MDETTKRIAVVQGAPSAGVQEMFRGIVDAWRPAVRVAGVIEEPHNLPGRRCRSGYLRSIVDGGLYPMFEDLGRGSDACDLAGAGAIDATRAVTRDIAGGCDLVLLSKFGKLEAGGEGLTEAFAAALAAGLPVLTSVSPDYEKVWEKFAAPLFVVLPADPQRIAAWWQALREDAVPAA
jgi:hypothetical protein